MAYSFRGGIHPPGHKDLTSHKPIEPVKPPEKVVIPMSMHLGAPCAPVVSVGDKVDLGQKVGEAKGFVSAPVHATVSGKVVEVAPKIHPGGSKVMSVVIQNDFEDRPASAVCRRNYESMSADEMTAVILDAGIVGHGGAAFPTHVKIKSGIGKVDTIIINGAECEPYITSDHRLLLEHPEEIIGGIEIILHIFGLKNARLAIENNKEDAFPGIRKLLNNRADISLNVLKPKYPQGAEKQLINALTGREVPSGKLPADAGCAVFNLDTAAAVYRAFTFGMPVIRRIVTVSGSAVANPKNLEARIGTPLGNLFEACGGFKEEPNKILMGGPMMGNPQFDLDAPVIKGTNALLAFTNEEYRSQKPSACIRCGKCVAVCPIRLAPTYIYMCGEKRRYAECGDLGVLDCIECGACAFECPARIPLVQAFRTAKQHVLDERAKNKK